MKNKRPIILITEGILLFLGIPLLFYWQLVPLPKIGALLLVAGYCGYQLWRDAEFGRSLLVGSKNSDTSKHILTRFLLVCGALVALGWIIQPEQFFAFPAERPFLWMVVMVLYPLLSALPQEFIYRTFFFHRYDSLTSLKYSTIILSALAFSFLHIVYDNWWAVGLSFVAGLLFGSTYARTKSLFWVTVEHVIYGWLIFTLGFGTYFYEPF
ncbi:CAAX protease self-immunity [Fodinibius roseus]|uniref:CAAX protease self-immunity n=1 Tax=Fodinibius roseus TaxID=1194090 RepID=A0A1M5ADA4_9BACT|nr:CPBP family intramembrane glutamic endopeptidase [Fodinibius roseus]SHF28249.1 CAAX protease self-immunity [Fodinibius roseus]